MKRKKGYFSISAVAKMFSVHQQTIRLYEKEGLITPKRSEGGTRMFSEEDIDRLEEIIYLTHKMGVNLAGVELVLRLQKKIKKLQEEVNKVFNHADKQLEEESALFKKNIKEQLNSLREIKEKNEERPLTLEDKKSKKQEKSSNFSETEEWEVDYDE